MHLGVALFELLDGLRHRGLQLVGDDLGADAVQHLHAAQLKLIRLTHFVFVGNCELSPDLHIIDSFPDLNNELGVLLKQGSLRTDRLFHFVDKDFILQIDGCQLLAS